MHILDIIKHGLNIPTPHDRTLHLTSTLIASRYGSILSIASRLMNQLDTNTFFRPNIKPKPQK
ncbi:MAG: hypothetical protein KAR87_01260 [Candidatus Aenigmarchaeota archaeon]|nr:hypothetical protein [Candidatus Aenigmarchaeota archaeon]